MYRIKIKDKKTGKIELVWKAYSRKDKKILYYKDIELNNLINDSSFDEIKNDCNTPFQLFGIECGTGWFSLIKPVIDYIDNYNLNQEKEEDKIQILQIKEKFGTLRIYTSFMTHELDNLIEKAEEESSKTCEICGTKKNIGSTLGYYTTCCHDCCKKMSLSNQYSHMWHNYENNNVYWIHPDKDDEFISTIDDLKKEMP